MTETIDLTVQQSAGRQPSFPARLVHATLRVTNERIMFPRRYAFLTKDLSPFLAGARSVLDVGSSNGRLISKLTAGLDSPRVVGVDVFVQADSVIPIEQYDGATLPFADGSFDTVVLIDVLHHADDPPALLAEAARVAKQHVLVKDHYFKSRLDWQILQMGRLRGQRSPRDPPALQLPGFSGVAQSDRRSWTRNPDRATVHTLFV